MIDSRVGNHPRVDWNKRLAWLAIMAFCGLNDVDRDEMYLRRRPAGILGPMATSSVNPRPRHASSPFQPHREPKIEQYALDDRVSHDSYGMGRVVGVDAGGATVDFSSKTVRITTPFRKMTKL